MRRRDFITIVVGSAVGWPLATHTQQQSRRIGVVIGYAENDPETRSRLEAFRRGLAKRGWSEGHNIHIDYRFAAGDAAQISVLAKETIVLKPEVIVAHTTRVAEALQKATREIVASRGMQVEIFTRSERSWFVPSRQPRRAA